MALPLQGKTILNTRPPHQAEELTVALRQAGAQVIEFPVLEIRACPLAEELLRVLSNLSAGDWLLFTSANGVTCLCDQFPPALLQRASTAVIGEATAAAARKAGLNVSFVSAAATADAMAAEFAQAITGAAGRIVVVQAREANEVLVETMRKTAKETYRAVVYEATVPAKQAAELERLSSLLHGGAVSAVLATSSNAVRNLLRLASADETLLKNIPLFVIGPKTERTARELGFAVVVVSAKAEAASLAKSAADYFAASSPEKS